MVSLRFHTKQRTFCLIVIGAGASNVVKASFNALGPSDQTLLTVKTSRLTATPTSKITGNVYAAFSIN